MHCWLYIWFLYLEQLYTLLTAAWSGIFFTLNIKYSVLGPRRAAHPRLSQDSDMPRPAMAHLFMVPETLWAGSQLVLFDM